MFGWWKSKRKWSDWIRALDAALSPSELKWLRLRLDGGREAAVAYLDSVVDRRRLREDVVRPLVDAAPDPKAIRRVLSMGEPAESLSEIKRKVLDGWAAVFVDGAPLACTFDLFHPAARDVPEPSTEQTLLGPKYAFVEQLRVNLNLVRSRLPVEELRIEQLEIGRRSRTKVAVLSVKDVTNREILHEVREGLKSLDIDWVDDASVLSELLFGRTLTPFPLGQLTERPVRVARALMNGRVAVLVDGSPFALIVPTTLVELQKDSEGFLQGPLNRLFARFLRAAGTLLAVLGPATYAALLAVNPQILPTPLAVTVAVTREGVPYPVLGEILVLLLLQDLVQQAAMQAPGPLGQTLTIVGSLIIGQAAVTARLASSLVIIVLAGTAIGSLIIVNFPLSFAIRIWKYPITVLAGFLGAFGLVAGFASLLVHLASLQSAGVPYLKPFAPLNWYDLVHYSVVAPSRQAIERRPQTWRAADTRRTGSRARQDGP